ncbi:MAG: hypothetical protein IT336_07680 [Thermomicrobiales bacterium]|nr:hypothetical protein [Thermomicrobiales bacterium]
MRAWLRLLLTLLVLVGAASPPDALGAKSADTAVELLPGPDAFGAGWSVARSAALEIDPALFREAAVAIHAGPNGTRVLIAVMLVTRDQVAVRRAWEAAVDIYDNYSGELQYVTGRGDELAEEPPPAGCAEAKRIDGTARQLGVDTGIPMGITLCAAEPDVIVLAVASGNVLGLTGFAASDAIASLVVTTAPTAAAEP